MKRINPRRKDKSLNRSPICSLNGENHFGRNSPGKLMLAVLVLNPIAAALATDECGLASPGAPITCNGSIPPGGVTYSGFNLSLIMDGTNSPVSVDKVTVNAAYLNDAYDLSITTLGQTSITGNDDYLISLRKDTNPGELSGDVLLNIGGNTALDLNNTNSGTAIRVENINYSDELSNTKVDISAGTHIAVDTVYDAWGVSIDHSGPGDVQVNYAGQMQILSDYWSGGLWLGKYNGSQNNAGDVLLNIVGDAQLNLISGDSGTAVSVSNFSGNDVIKSNTTVNISADTRIDVDAVYQAKGVDVNHSGSGNVRVEQAGQIQISSEGSWGWGWSSGLLLNAQANSSYLENTGLIELKKKDANIGFWGTAIEFSVSTYDDQLPTNTTIIHSGSIIGGITDPVNDYITGIYGYFGNYSQPINAGSMQVISSGDITKVTNGIEVVAWSENNDYLNVRQDSGRIEAEGIGIYAISEDGSSDVRVTTSGQIITGANPDTKGIYITSSSGGLAVLGQAIVEQGAAGEILNKGTGGSTAGIHVEAALVTDITVAGKVRSTVGTGVLIMEEDRGYINTEENNYPTPANFVFDNRDRTFNVTLESGGIIEGGSQDAGISTFGGNRLNVKIAQGGTLGALSDVALKTAGYDTNDFSQMAWDGSGYSNYDFPSVWIDAAPTILNNSGVMTGSLQLESGQDTFTNENTGVWNLRRFADTDDDGIRDTLSVAVAQFAVGGSGNSINNRGTINLRNDGGTAVTLDASGAYTTGYAANAMTLGGAVQGQILGVQTFSNSGIIDISGANGVAGDVLWISGGHLPGSAGGGVFVSNGGSIRFDTVLNEGGANSQSDMLVVDATRLGSAATAIDVRNAGGAGAQTVVNGVELVRVLDPAQSASGVFQLNGRLVAGAYEYDLYHGGVGANAGDGNWYLRSMAIPNTSPNPVPSLRPETGAYLNNLTVAANMSIFTLHDRLMITSCKSNGAGGSSVSRNAPGAGDVSHNGIPVAWAYLSRSRSEGRTSDHQVDTDTDTTLLRFGSDIYRWEASQGGHWHVGLMGSYGRSDTDNQSRHLGHTNSGMARTAKGTVEGYSVGAYTTWYGGTDKLTDSYLDMWALYGWYDNTVKGNRLRKESYDSRGFTASIEGGYSFTLIDRGHRQWLVQPQAQLAYSHFSADDHVEYNGTRIRVDDASGIVSRLGARLFSRSKQGASFDIQPFVEANWWHSNAKNTLFFNEVKLRDDTPKNRFELKTGFQGELSKGFQVWAHIGAQRGKNDYRQYEGMIGLRKEF